MIYWVVSICKILKGTSSTLFTNRYLFGKVQMSHNKPLLQFIDKRTMTHAADVSGSSCRSAHAQPEHRDNFDSLPTETQTASHRWQKPNQTLRIPHSCLLSPVCSPQILQTRKMIWFYYYRPLNKQCNDANDAREAQWMDSIAKNTILRNIWGKTRPFLVLYAIWAGVSVVMIVF